MQPNSRGPEVHPVDHPVDHPEDRPEDRPECQGLCHKVDRQGWVVLCLDRQVQVFLCPECSQAHKEWVFQ